MCPEPHIPISGIKGLTDSIRDQSAHTVYNEKINKLSVPAHLYGFGSNKRDDKMNLNLASSINCRQIVRWYDYFMADEGGSVAASASVLQLLQNSVSKNSNAEQISG